MTINCLKTVQLKVRIWCRKDCVEMTRFSYNYSMSMRRLRFIHLHVMNSKARMVLAILRCVVRSKDCTLLDKHVITDFSSYQWSLGSVRKFDVNTVNKVSGIVVSALSSYFPLDFESATTDIVLINLTYNIRNTCENSSRY
jgi:hypothetical protein